MKFKNKAKKKLFNLKKLNFKFLYNNKYVNSCSFFLLGIIFCMFILFLFAGKKNYIKLYSELKNFIDVYDIITNDYYGDLKKNDLITGAIDSMLSSVGDEYTSFINKSSTETFFENVDGIYEGIGCLISNDINGNIIVVDVFEDSPAFDVGIMKDDIIVSVDKKEFLKKTSTELSDYIKKNNNKTISLTVERNEKLIEFNIKRKEIEVATVSSKLIDCEKGAVGYIDIDIFSAVTYEQIKKELKKLEKEDILGLILDVRDNNGGYLSSVSDIASLFLQKGKTIYQLENDEEIIKVTDKTKEKRNYPIVVLVNENSASASEILASAIKESYNGYVVGVNTYGKGTVQKLKKLDDGSMIKYTIQKWLTPNGIYIEEEGVIPNLIIPFNYELDYDNQLKESIDLIIK